MIRKFTTSKNRLLIGILSILFFLAALFLFKMSICRGSLMLLITSFLVTLFFMWKMDYVFYDTKFAVIRPSISYNEFAYYQIYDVFAIYSQSERTEGNITLKPGYALFIRTLPDYAVYRIQLETNQKGLCQEMLNEFKTRLGAEKVKDIRTTVEEPNTAVSDQKASVKKSKKVKDKEKKLQKQGG
ncbi:MAG: hypothetical protein ABII22_01010 [Candidatus Micrarchaeota archaeon]